MKSECTFAVDFIIRKSKSDKSKALIYARISVNGERTEISIREQINTSDWNPDNGKLKGSKPEIRRINDYIDDVRSRIKQKYRAMEFKEELITADIIKKAYIEPQIQSRGPKLTELLDYFKKIWENKMKKGGFKNYKTTADYIRLFLNTKFNGDLHLSKVNMQVATDFEHYIRTTPIKKHDPCVGNGLAKHIQRFKRILNWGAEIEWIKVNPIEKYSCPVKKSRRKKLDLTELVSIENKKFNDAMLNYVNELFISSCYTGLAYADAMALEEKDFEWETNGTVWCRIYRTKTEGLCAVPVLNRAATILNKYRQDAREKKRLKIFPSVSNKTVNESLKIIREMCGITTPLTFHVARHTFAKTVALKNGVPLETVQMLMGHSKISTTQIYADVDEEKILEDMTGLENRISKKKESVLERLKTSSSFFPGIHPL